MTARVSMSAIVDEYVRLTPRSREHFERSRALVPAGATRSLNSWLPHPIYVRRGKGPLVWDVDGREYIDFLNNYTGLILGHAHPAVTAAIAERLESGTSFGFSTELEAELAGLLVERVPSVERVRFTGSGSEAVMFALRLARAFTGRMRVAKMEGGFHGAQDDVMVSVRPQLAQAGPISRPVALPETNGLPSGLAERVLVLPFNHVDETTALIEAHAGELSAVIVEPMLGVGGMIPPAPGYLERLRELCTRHGIVLIFDEVISLRLAPGGAQQHYQVTPDLTVMGKIIGGGLPVGAVGGRAEVMALLEPRGGHDMYDPRAGGPALYQGGTFTGNPLTLAAGLATLRELTPDRQASLNALGDELRGKVADLLRRLGAPATITGAGSIFTIHMTGGPVQTFRDARRADSVLQQGLFLGLLNEGVMLAPRGMGSLSTQTTALHVDHLVDAVGRVISILCSGGAAPRAGG